MFQIEKCLICNAVRTPTLKGQGENGEDILDLKSEKWISAIGLYYANDIYLDKMPTPFDYITICPNCRDKTTIKQLYLKLIEKAREAQKEQVHEAEKRIKEL